MTSLPISVLIVDDDPTIAAMLKEVVRNLGEGYETTSVWADRGAKAREELKARSHQLVLLDFLLPDEDGLAVLAAINELPAPDRPVVIMLTGGGSEQVAVEAMKLGARDYLVKTALSFPTLRRSIVAAMAHHRLEQALARSTDELNRKNLQMEADLALARGVQQALLPQSYPVFPPGVPPARSRLQFCHRWIPSEKVAGDLFDVFAVGENAAGVFQCDVMGHGVRAALVTALLRGLVREQMPLAERPDAFLAEINRSLLTLLGQTGDLVFVTATYLVVDATSGRVSLASAGHPAPLHLGRASGRVAPLLAADGPGAALGLLPDTVYPVAQCTLAPGDVILLFTDGIFEATNAAGDEFGRNRLGEVLQAGLLLSAPSLLDLVLTGVRAFRGAGAQGFEDDICLVTVERAAE